MNDEDKPFHYFGSTCYGWAKGNTPEFVLETLARIAGTDAIKQQLKQNKGLYAWVCKVDVPRSTKYQINFFQPQGVSISDTQEFLIMNTKGWCLPITKESHPCVIG